MFKKLLREIVNDLWPELREDLKQALSVTLVQDIRGVYKLDKNAQYMIIVKDDETAQQLVQAINDHLDPQMRIIVLAAADVSLVEISKGGK